MGFLYGIGNLCKGGVYGPTHVYLSMSSGAAIGVSNSFLSKDFVGSLDYNLLKIERKEKKKCVS
jgi:hypothetical protein